MAITVGDTQERFTRAIAEAAASRPVGYGLDEGVQMGPVITPESKARIEGLIEVGVREGAKVLVDGRQARIPRYARGNFIRPTIREDVSPAGTIAATEIFGPVLSMLHARTVEEAIALINGSAFGNMACLFTRSGAAARKFRYDAQAGNIGINLGVAAPIAFFPFTGWKGSFFGGLHAQGRDAIEFYTDKQVVIERWPRAWSRTF